jgi:acyl-CoA synthetase (AMP-forming)/AMP-acid ligase II
MLLRDFLRRCAVALPHELAYVCEGIQRTWQEIDQRSDALAAALQALGVRAGQTVAFLGGNRTEAAETWLACAKAGFVRTGINKSYSCREMLHTIRDSDARAVLVQPSGLEALGRGADELMAEGRLLVGLDGSTGLPYEYEELIARRLMPALPPIDDTAIALIGYTSGSTGMPKGVMLSHRAVALSGLYQAFGPGFTRDDVRLYCANTAGINISTACANVFNGMTTVFADFEVGHVLDLVERHRVTRTTLVPTMLRRVVEAVRGGGRDVSSLRQLIYGSAPATPALIRDAYNVLGCELVQIYGASESCGPFTLLSDRDHRAAVAGRAHLLTSAGRPYPFVEVSIRDAHGTPLEAGATGTIWVRGDTIMSGYLNRAEETREALPVPGWLRTGDVASMDESGYLYLSDRHKNMIISGGMNIHPPGIENAIAEHPAVREVVVVGVPHPEWGEAVVAAVTLRDDAHASADALTAHCRALLAKWEVPKHIEIMKALPEGFTGKVNKREIREQLVAARRLPWMAGPE